MVHITFDESNPKPLEVEVIDRAGILKKTNLKENKQETEQGQSYDRVVVEEHVQHQNMDTPSDHEDLPT